MNTYIYTNMYVHHTYIHISFRLASLGVAWSLRGADGWCLVLIGKQVVVLALIGVAWSCLVVLGIVWHCLPLSCPRNDGSDPHGPVGEVSASPRRLGSVEGNA